MAEIKSKSIQKTIQDIQKEVEELYKSNDLKGNLRMTKKATKKKTVKAIFPIPGQPHFNLYINDKIHSSYLFNGKEWTQG